ncbi:Hint domain-containing protein [Sulfitobacter aestuariivivens]|uniref:Hint domain-containing protein n=1 Tax=Sulfitobacter aestuariivivens TaxID=2766981 RepID=A0A927HGF2_9RHOB|nr:Hint domain-containing protein [Sulfitobacter aestuariivivens]MBD3665453.1 Hint domain-containing protein [Sulfitobacter aestuariivivens]
MALLELTAQSVNGDPLISGSNINIVNGSVTSLQFTDFDFQLFDPAPGETVSLDGGLTQLTYEFLGYGDVRNDTLQHAAFIRVDMGDGTFDTFAIDMNADGDALPNLATGNTKLTVAGLSSGPAERFPAPACFTPGTMIDTPGGPRLIETLARGDLVSTLDHGAQPLRLMIRNTFHAFGALAPIRIEAGALGNADPLVVSQQHRMLLSGWRAELHFGQSEVLVAAKHLVNGTSIRPVMGGTVDYIHLIFDRHEIVFGAGIPSESFYLGQNDAFSDQGVLAQLKALMPQQDWAAQSQLPTARPVLRRVDMQALAA